MTEPTDRWSAYTDLSPTVASGWRFDVVTPPSRLGGSNGMTIGPDRRLYVTSGNTVVREYMVSVGEEGEFDTPDGQFTIQRMIWNPSWTPPPTTAPR